jgi:limonene-1,2-epoxide hydrolase
MNTTKSLTRRAFSTAGIAGLAAICLPRLVSAQAAAQEAAPLGKIISADEEKANVQVVQDFCAAWAKKDADKISSLLADDCSFRLNQTRPPLVGKDKVMENVKSAFERSNTDFKILRTVVMGPVVLAQRDDIVSPVNGDPARHINIAAGFFFVQNGKISEWTDYVIR